MHDFILEPEAVNADGMKCVNGFYFPGNDEEGSRSAFATLPHLDAALEFVKDFHICVQAGGNAGVWPKRLAKLFKVVYTFEPDPVNFGYLYLNVTDRNVYKFPAALGNEYGNVDMVRFPANCGANYVQGGGYTPVMRIDDLCLPACGLIQLDVEGMELQALMGARQTILNYRPVLMVEMKQQGRRYGYEDEQLVEYIENLGYKEIAHHGRDHIYKWNL